MASTTAYLLVSHGSRDPRPQAAMDRLAQLVRECLQYQTLEKQYLAAPAKPMAVQSIQPLTSPPIAWPSAGIAPLTSRQRLKSSPDQPLGRQRESRSAIAQLDIARQQVGWQSLSGGESPLPSWTPIVGTACLELGNRPLNEQICDFGQRAKAAGASLVKLIPMFLMQGVHVMDDLPQALDQALYRLQSAIEVELCPHVGSHPALSQMLADRLAAVKSGASLLVAHGSRRSSGNKAIAAIARQINATTAYWSVPPDVESQAIDLMQQGHQRIAILPYFLFTGGITDAITQRTEELAERFPKIGFRLLPPIGATRDLAKLVLELTA
ncbi:MAG: CbiX/SirB N-terminal domain-containing protein [Cyanobacteria bacterium J06635_15]